MATPAKKPKRPTFSTSGVLQAGAKAQTDLMVKKANYADEWEREYRRQNRKRK